MSSYVPGYARHPRYEQLRRSFVERCIDDGGLQPSDRVLDVGCGIGGVAAQLTDYLTDGRYVGLDVDPQAVAQARADLGPDDRFTFEVIDVWSKKYNPAPDAVRPEDYRFPFDDASFDFAVLRSVFTHLVPEDISHYVGEIARVLRPGGRAVITYFLLNDQSGRSHDDPNVLERFPYSRGHYRLRDEDVPEVAVAVDEDWVRDLYERRGLKISDVAYSNWDGTSQGGSGQDVVICEKQD